MRSHHPDQGALGAPSIYDFGAGTVVPYRAGEPSRGASRRAARHDAASRPSLSPRAFAASCRSSSTSRPAASTRRPTRCSRSPPCSSRCAATARWLAARRFVTTSRPFPGSNLEPASLAVTGIDPHHPLRPAISGGRRPAADFPRGAHRRTRRRMHARRAGRPQRVLRFEFLECRGGAHADQAQPLPSVLELRHRDLGRRRLRSNGADARDPGGRLEWDTAPRIPPPTMQNDRGSVLHRLQSVSRRIRGEPPAPGGHGTAGNRAGRPRTPSATWNRRGVVPAA